MIDGHLVWISNSDSVIPNDKYGFIMDMGIKTFIRECCFTTLYLHDGVTLEQFIEECIEWAKIPDDWTKEDWIKACAPMLPEVYEEELERKNRMIEWAEKHREGNDD